jgi:branched-chain amino acid transport system permease protein
LSPIGVLRLAGLILLGALALLVPVLVPDPAWTNIGVFTMMFVGLATSWNIMGGYTGYISLGHAGFFGFGCYALGLPLAHLHIGGGFAPFFLVPLAGLLTALFAIPVGWVALRTRAATFVIVTIAVMFMLQLAASNLIGLTGGTGGLRFPNPGWSGDVFNDPFYYAMLVLAVVAIATSWAIRRSKFGLGLLAIRDDEDKAMAVGVPTRTFKLTAFVISATLVGMIGGVYGYYVTYVYPEFVIDPLTGISMVLMAFLGGLGTLAGPVLGALLVEPSQLWLAYTFGALRLYLVFYAALFLLVILVLPRGIVPSVADLVRGWRRRRASGPTATAGGSQQASAPSAGNEPTTPAPQPLASP